MPTLVLQMDGANKALVKNVINLVAGTPYDPGPGLVTLFVANGTFVGPGFTGTLTEAGWTWAPPPADEPPPPVASVQEQIDALQATVAEAAAKIDELKAAIG